MTSRTSGPGRGGAWSYIAVGVSKSVVMPWRLGTWAGGDVVGS